MVCMVGKMAQDVGMVILSFRNGKRRKVGGEAEGKMHGQLFHLHKTKNCHKPQMFPSKIVNPYITLLYLWGLVYKSPAHFMWATIRFTEKVSIDCHHKGCST